MDLPSAVRTPRLTLNPPGVAGRLLRVCVMTASLGLLTACSSIAVDHLPKADQLPLAEEGAAGPEPAYRIRAGDDLDFKFFYARELNETMKVRPDGQITLALIDDIQAAGLTPRELGEALSKRYAPHVRNPAVSVIVRSFTGYRAYVGGEVAQPQTLPLDGGLTPLQAIYRAGGVRPTADMGSVVLIRKGADGQPVAYQLDLSDDAVSKGRRDLAVALRPSDVLYVPRSPIANANRFVQQYIVDLILFRGIQLNYSIDEIRSRGGSNAVVP